MHLCNQDDKRHSVDDTSTGINSHLLPKRYLARKKDLSFKTMIFAAMARRCLECRVEVRKSHPIMTYSRHCEMRGFNIVKCKDPNDQCIVATIFHRYNGVYGIR